MSEKGPNWHLRDKWWHPLVLNNYIYGAMWIVGLPAVGFGAWWAIELLEAFVKS